MKGQEEEEALQGPVSAGAEQEQRSCPGGSQLLQGCAPGSPSARESERHSSRFCLPPVAQGEKMNIRGRGDKGRIIFTLTF